MIEPARNRYGLGRYGRRAGWGHTAQDGVRPPGAGVVERLLLAFEELVSDALRHGRAPVELIVTSTDRA